MRATAKVSVQQGQLFISSCKLFKAIDDGEKVGFNQLHAKCKGKLNQILHCNNCDADIVDKKTEILKGYPVGNRFVVLSQDEIDSCKREATDIVRVFQYIDPEELSPIYFSGANFLIAEKEGLEPFALWYFMLKETGKLALAKMVARGKDNFLAIQPYDEKISQGVLIAYDLYFPNQIRSTKEIDTALNATAFDTETVDLAIGLVKKMCRPFNPALIKDEYNDALRELIRARESGEKIDVVEKQSERKVLSLKDALRGSLAA